MGGPGSPVNNREEDNLRNTHTHTQGAGVESEKGEGGGERIRATSQQPLSSRVGVKASHVCASQTVAHKRHSFEGFAMMTVQLGVPAEPGSRSVCERGCEAGRGFVCACICLCVSRSTPDTAHAHASPPCCVVLLSGGPRTSVQLALGPVLPSAPTLRRYSLTSPSSTPRCLSLTHTHTHVRPYMYSTPLPAWTLVRVCVCARYVCPHHKQVAQKRLRCHPHSSHKQ